MKFKSELDEITSENPKHKSNGQSDTMKNVQNFYDSSQKIIDLFNDNAKVKSKVIHKRKQAGTGLKILIPKQLLQRLPIVLAQAKVSNDSDSVLNEIIQIVYSLYQSKKLAKKVYNSIIKSIQI